MTKLIELFVRQMLRGFHLVGLGNFVVGVRQAFRELCIVRQNQQTAGVEIEAADGREPGSGVFDEVVNRGTSIGIAIRNQFFANLSQGLPEANCVVGKILPIMKSYVNTATSFWNYEKNCLSKR